MHGDDIIGMPLWAWLSSMLVSHRFNRIFRGISSFSMDFLILYPAQFQADGTCFADAFRKKRGVVMKFMMNICSSADGISAQRRQITLFTISCLLCIAYSLSNIACVFFSLSHVNQFCSIFQSLPTLD